MSASPPPRPGPLDAGPVVSAAVCAFAMIANQVGGKAARDALFLSQWDVEVLPRMVIGASVLTIGAVLLSARTLARVGPPRLVPIAFFVSGLVQFGLGFALPIAPRATAVGLYAHLAVFGAVLISWYWSMISERFDPRSARRNMARIAGGGTLGGLIGGLVAERVAASLSIAAMFPILGSMHLACAVLAWRVAAGGVRAPEESPDRSAADSGARGGLRIVRETPYVRHLALLVLGGTVAAALLDFVFKARAVERFRDGDELLRFFGLFYTGVALVTFVVQSTVTRRALAKLPPARTVSILPLTVGIGGLAALLAPFLGAIAAARGAESAVRSSLFRSGYELFFGPLPRTEKRAAKTIVDVGFDRLGDALGGGLVALALLVGAAPEVLLGLAAVFGFSGLLVTRRLHAGYVGALARSLVERGGGEHPAVETPADETYSTQSAYLATVAHLELSGPLPELGSDLTQAMPRPVEGDEADSPTNRAAAPTPGADRRTATADPGDPLLAQLRELRSGDPGRVRRALRGGGRLRRELVPAAIGLLAWDVVAADAAAALRGVGDRHVGALLDRLLDPEEEFAIRRRIPRLLPTGDERSVEGLLRALSDRRFEVRYQIGVALSRIRRATDGPTIDRERVLAAVEREAAVDRKVWEGHRLLDEIEDADGSPFHDEVLRARATRSLEHVFTLLSLAYPPEPLRIAYRGLHASDANLRGTALEYLDSVLPRSIRRSLAPFLSVEATAPDRRPAEDVLESLMQSRDSIRLDLEALRRRSVTPPDGDEPRAPGRSVD